MSIVCVSSLSMFLPTALVHDNENTFSSTCFDSTIFLLVLSLAILPSALLRACITKSQQPWYDRLVVAHPTALGSASQHAYNRDSPAGSSRIFCLHTKECMV